MRVIVHAPRHAALDAGKIPVLLRYVQDGVALGVKTKEQAYDDLSGLLQNLLKRGAA